jgi:hypothetical protein
MNGSMSSRLPSLTPPPRTLDAAPSIQGVGPHSPSSTGRFTCPNCPRIFTEQAKLTRHVQTYRHAHFCPVSSCPWNFNLPKDLRRHLAQHNPQAPRYQCPVNNCPSTRAGHGFTRPDLLTRHMERFHG